MQRHQLAARGVVELAGGLEALQDAPGWVRGALFGRVHHTAPDLGEPRTVVLSVTPDTGVHRAEIGVAITPGASP